MYVDDIVITPRKIQYNAVVKLLLKKKSSRRNNCLSYKRKRFKNKTLQKLNVINKSKINVNKFNDSSK